MKEVLLHNWNFMRFIRLLAGFAIIFQGVPTLIIFKKGQPVWRKRGVVLKLELIKILQEHQ